MYGVPPRSRRAQTKMRNGSMKWICIMLAMALPVMAQESSMSDGSSEDVFRGNGAAAEMVRHLDRVADRAERKLAREARPKQEKDGLTTAQKQIAERKELARRPFTAERTSSQKRLDARNAAKLADKPAAALPAPKIEKQPLKKPLDFIGKQPALGALPPAPAGAEEPPLPLEAKPEAGDPDAMDVMTRLDRLEFSVIQAQPMPEEIMNIIPYQVGSVSNDPILRLNIGTGGSNSAYWGSFSNLNQDVKVSVGTNSVAGYLGYLSSDGVLRTDNTIDYDTSDTNWVELSVDASNVWTQIVTNNYYGTNSAMPPGNYHGQMLWWDTNTTAWILTDQPTSPSVLVFDNTDETEGTVRWEEIDTDYKGIFRGTDDNITNDWPRFHAE